MKNIKNVITTLFILSNSWSMCALAASEQNPWAPYEMPSDVLTKVQAQASQMQNSGNCKGISVQIICGPELNACTQISVIANQALRNIGRTVGFDVPPAYNYAVRLKMWENGGRRPVKPQPPKTSRVYSSLSRASCAQEIADVVSIMAPSVVEQEIMPNRHYFQADNLPRAVVPLMTSSVTSLDDPNTVYVEWRSYGMR